MAAWAVCLLRAGGPARQQRLQWECSVCGGARTKDQQSSFTGVLRPGACGLMRVLMARRASWPHGPSCRPSRPQLPSRWAAPVMSCLMPDD